MGVCFSTTEGKGVYIRRRRLTLSQSEAVLHEDSDEHRGSLEVKNQQDDESILSGLVRQVTRNNLIDLFPDSARRFSLSGKPTNSNQKGFENKKTEAVGLSHITDYRVGYACKKGLKPESPNQDDFFVIGIDGLGMFGVFDGHGPYGHDISSFCHDTLPGLLIKDKEFYSAPRDAFKRAFQYTNMLCEQASSRRKFDSSLSGTTATVVVTRDETIYCAWVGDSRAVIGTIDENGKIVAEDLSRDHKPEIPEEKSRIVAKGGQVKRLKGDIPYRVFLKGKRYPGLAMSRSLGDSMAVSVGVIHEPEINIRGIDRARDRFVVLCSDGVWEFISSQTAVEILNRYSPGDVQKAAEALAQEAWKRWLREEDDVVDDITVIVAWLGETNSNQGGKSSRKSL